MSDEVRKGNLIWRFGDDDTLTISGTGVMEDWSIEELKQPKKFDWCFIEKVIIEEGVTTIGAITFCGLFELKEVIIPDSVTKIGDYAFDNCFNLSKIRIPDSVTEIGYGVFRDCHRLTEVTIPASVKEVGEKVFDGCDRLEKIFYPAGADFADKLREGNDAELIPY